MSKIVLITGASRGIGAATARLAARRGYDVAINYAGNRAAAEIVAADVRAAGQRAAMIQADVGDPEQVKSLFARVDAELGRIDAFVNNAGILWPHSRFVDITREQLARSVAVNLVGTFTANQEAVKRMSTRLGGKGGVIVNMSSMAAKLGGAFECLDYAVTKGGMDSMTVGIAKELAAEGIRVNGLRPGLIATEIHASAGEPGRVARLMSTVPLGRAGTAEDVAEAVLWLLSDASSYITGMTIDVAGGRGI
ncbi:MAG TPA: SDR family oxidoreductase [Hyphomicrobiaceae bacterium]|nr:SDR family oxidoreductase [Hyphomicrobiaceae bacterium]